MGQFAFRVSSIMQVLIWIFFYSTAEIQQIENRIEMLSTSGAGGWQNIRNLQKEREYLRQRQQEIQNQVLLIEIVYAIAKTQVITF